MQNEPRRKYVFNTQETIGYRFPTHSAELVMDRSDAEASEAFLVVLEPGQSPPLHSHDDTEQVFYVLAGEGELYIGTSGSPPLPVRSRDLVRIPPQTHHRILCRGQERLVYLSIDCFVDGRPSSEPTWESHLRVVCEQNGWDFEHIRKS